MLENLKKKFLKRSEFWKAQREFDKGVKEFNRLMKYAEDVADMSKPLKEFKER